MEIYWKTSAERGRLSRAGWYEQAGGHTTIRTHVEKHARRLAAAQALAYRVFVLISFHRVAVATRTRSARPCASASKATLRDAKHVDSSTIELCR